MAQIALTEPETKSQYLRFARMYPIVVQTHFAWNYDQSVLFVSERPKREEWRRDNVCAESIVTCIDERVSDMVAKLGLMTGIPHVSRSPGCLEASVANHLHQERYFGHHELYCGKGDKVGVHLATYHYSEGYPSSGCAARGNNTAQYKLDMIEYAKAMNRASSSGIAFAVGWDTNLDAATIHGPDGDLATVDYARKPEEPADILQQQLVMDLERIFPRKRELIQRKPGWMIEAFYREFATQLVHHIACIRERIPTFLQNGPEMEPHTGRLAFIGQPLDMEPPRGTTFLLEDNDPRLMRDYVEIPMRFICMNALLAATRSGNDSDFIIPFIVSIPYRKGHAGLKNEGFKKETSLSIATMVHSVAEACLPGIISDFQKEGWWKQISPHLQQIALKEALERVCTFPCVHNERTRLFTPVS